MRRTWQKYKILFPLQISVKAFLCCTNIVSIAIGRCCEQRCMQQTPHQAADCHHELHGHQHPCIEKTTWSHGLLVPPKTNKATHKSPWTCAGQIHETRRWTISVVWGPKPNRNLLECEATFVIHVRNMLSLQWPTTNTMSLLGKGAG